MNRLKTIKRILLYKTVYYADIHSISVNYVKFCSFNIDSSKKRTKTNEIKKKVCQTLSYTQREHKKIKIKFMSENIQTDCGEILAGIYYYVFFF